MTNDAKTELQATLTKARQSLDRFGEEVGRHGIGLARMEGMTSTLEDAAVAEIFPQAMDHLDRRGLESAKDWAAHQGLRWGQDSNGGMYHLTSIARSIAWSRAYDILAKFAEIERLTAERSAPSA